ncbi:MAG TPA: glycosyltransferase family 2 protein [Thermoanaerobaculia bacterium]|nr:glycosyltransferase family 2 protein [Thermoanaerobaculia bacterium]
MSTAKAQEPELTVVMPCLNEAETVAVCVEKALRAFAEHGIAGEVVLADNGSTDGSQELARAAGARVVEVRARGYGNALRGGIEAARGRFVIMGDADDSYDFSQLEPFVAKLREGWELVMGNRFRGGVERGAMPWKNRWIGNPALSGLGRLFFRAPVGDFHCGLRGFSVDAFRRMGLRTTGMEFASEMVIKAHLKGMRITEVPIRLYPDGRSRPPHLHPWRDGWRHLRFMLLFSPRWLFLIPGLLLLLVGAVVSAALVAGPLYLGGVGFDIHTLLVAAFLCVLGYQLVVFAVFSRVYAVLEGFHPHQRVLDRMMRFARLESGLLVGALLVLGGALVLGFAVWGWRDVGFGSLDPRNTMRQLIPAVTLMTLGVQTVFASFFLSLLGLPRVGLGVDVADGGGHR